MKIWLCISFRSICYNTISFYMELVYPCWKYLSRTSTNSFLTIFPSPFRSRSVNSPLNVLISNGQVSFNTSLLFSWKETNSDQLISPFASLSVSKKKRSSLIKRDYAENSKLNFFFCLINDPPKKLNKATIFLCIGEEIVGCCIDIINWNFIPKVF